MSRPRPPRTPPLSQPRPSNPPTALEGERLQKLIAGAGLASRRTAEDWIRAGRVRVNGEVAGIGDRAGPQDRVEIDGAQIVVRDPGRATRVIMYHKPVGELVTRKDPGGRPTVFARLPSLQTGKWIAVGRLDYNTSGLLLFTDDGELANRLMHPRYGVEREYAIRIQGRLDAKQLAALRAGVMIGDESAKFERIEAAEEGAADGVNHWYRGMLKEGRNREVRRLMEAVGQRVSRLIRVRYGPQDLPRDLPAGAWRELPGTGVDSLVRIAGEAKIR